MNGNKKSLNIVRVPSSFVVTSCYTALHCVLSFKLPYWHIATLSFRVRIHDKQGRKTHLPSADNASSPPPDLTREFNSLHGSKGSWSTYSSDAQEELLSSIKIIQQERTVTVNLFLPHFENWSKPHKLLKIELCSIWDMQSTRCDLITSA